MNIEMDAPILQPNYTGAQSAPVDVDGKIGTSISTSILTSNLNSISTSPFPGTLVHRYPYAFS